MIKLIVLAVRKQGMTFEEFDTYWREQHGPLVKSVTEFSRHVRKYVQSHRASGNIPLAGEAACDGVAELWFDSVDAMNEAFQEPRYLEVIRPDEMKFFDADRSQSIVCEEHPVI